MAGGSDLARQLTETACLTEARTAQQQAQHEAQQEAAAQKKKQNQQRQQQLMIEVRQQQVRLFHRRVQDDQGCCYKTKLKAGYQAA